MQRMGCAAGGSRGTNYGRGASARLAGGRARHRVAYADARVSDEAAARGSCGGDSREPQEARGPVWPARRAFLLSVWRLERVRARTGDGGGLQNGVHDGYRGEYGGLFAGRGEAL